MTAKGEHARDDLSAHLAALDAGMQTLMRDNEQLRAKIAALEQQHDVPFAPINWVPLKSVDIGTLSYETARSWCERGFVKARKQGGRWLVDPESLRATIVSRISSDRQIAR